MPFDDLWLGDDPFAATATATATAFTAAGTT